MMVHHYAPLFPLGSRYRREASQNLLAEATHHLAPQMELRQWEEKVQDLAVPTPWRPADRAPDMRGHSLNRSKSCAQHLRQFLLRQGDEA